MGVEDLRRGQINFREFMEPVHVPTENDESLANREAMEYDAQVSPYEQPSQSMDAEKTVKAYTEDKNIPMSDLIKTKAWAVMSKSLKLTFLTEKHEQVYMRKFNKLKLDYMMSLPAYKLTFDTLLGLDNLELEFLNNVRRSIGIKGQVTNERTAHTQQTQHKLFGQLSAPAKKKNFLPSIV